MTTGDDLLQVAWTPATPPPEAFTRAFARAFGEAPSHWRRHATGYRIDAPSKVHFNPPGGLRVPAQRKVTGMDLLTRMVEHHVWLIGEMISRAEGLDDDVLDARVEISVDGIDNDPTLRSLLSRLVGQLAMWDAVTHDRPYDFEVERHESTASMRSRLADAGAAFLTQVRSIVDDGRLDETFVNALCNPPEVFTYGGMVAHVLTFAAHRRVLVCGALADAGIEDLGNGDPMRWVAA